MKLLDYVKSRDIREHLTKLECWQISNNKNILGDKNEA